MATTTPVPITGQQPPAKAVKKATPKKKAPSTKSAPQKYCATCFPGKSAPLPPRFVDAVKAIEAAVGHQVWLLIQDGPSGGFQPPAFHSIDNHTFRALWAARQQMPVGRPISLVIDSPGGSARDAYRIANFLRRRSGFNVFVPEYAKSAATLLCLGAQQIIMSSNAELGPLDTQVFDADREGFGSALDEVQALDRLNAFALQAVDSGIMLMRGRSGKSLEKLLPHVLHFVSEMVRPLFEKIDTVHYTSMSRLLKVAEEYAIRLLEPIHSKGVAEEIARKLVMEYPEHGFLIDVLEATEIGLQVSKPMSSDLEDAMNDLARATHGVVAIGQMKEVSS